MQSSIEYARMFKMSKPELSWPQFKAKVVSSPPFWLSSLIVGDGFAGDGQSRSRTVGREVTVWRTVTTVAVGSMLRGVVEVVEVVVGASVSCAEFVWFAPRAVLYRDPYQRRGF